MRILVLFGGLHSETDAAWLIESGVEAPETGYVEHFKLPAKRFGHVIGCTCCTPRGPAADALARMFRARAIGAAPFFKRVIVRASPAGEVALREALASDVVTAARYYLLGQET